MSIILTPRTQVSVQAYKPNMHPTATTAIDALLNDWYPTEAIIHLIRSSARHRILGNLQALIQSVSSTNIDDLCQELSTRSSNIWFLSMENEVNFSDPAHIVGDIHDRATDHQIACPIRPYTAHCNPQHVFGSLADDTTESTLNQSTQRHTLYDITGFDNSGPSTFLLPSTQACSSTLGQLSTSTFNQGSALSTVPGEIGVASTGYSRSYHHDQKSYDIESPAAAMPIPVSTKSNVEPASKQSIWESSTHGSLTIAHQKRRDSKQIEIACPMCKLDRVPKVFKKKRYFLEHVMRDHDQQTEYVCTCCHSSCGPMSNAIYQKSIIVRHHTDHHSNCRFREGNCSYHMPQRRTCPAECAHRKMTNCRGCYTEVPAVPQKRRWACFIQNCHEIFDTVQDFVEHITSISIPWELDLRISPSPGTCESCLSKVFLLKIGKQSTRLMQAQRNPNIVFHSNGILPTSKSKLLWVLWQPNGFVGRTAGSMREHVGISWLE